MGVVASSCTPKTDTCQSHLVIQSCMSITSIKLLTEQQRWRSDFSTSSPPHAAVWLPDSSCPGGCEVLSRLDLRLPGDRHRGAPSVCSCLSVSLLCSRHLSAREWRSRGALETDHACSHCHVSKHTVHTEPSRGERGSTLRRPRDPTKAAGGCGWAAWQLHQDQDPTCCTEGLPGGSDGKESACSAGDMGSIPGLGRPPGEGSGYPLQYSGLENPMDRGARGGAWLQFMGSQRVNTTD